MRSLLLGRRGPPEPFCIFPAHLGIFPAPLGISSVPLGIFSERPGVVSWAWLLPRNTALLRSPDGNSHPTQVAYRTSYPPPLSPLSSPPPRLPVNPLGREEQFDRLFKGLWVHEHPTPERNRYLVLALDFSQITADGGSDALREGFAEAVKNCIRPFVMRYSDRIPELRRLDALLDGYRDGATAIGALLGIIAGTEHKLYVLIDEYDNFANRLLSGGAQDLYESMVRDTGFVRSFYATLKAGTRTGAVARMFITGVSPIMLDDLSSGFNILTHISQHPRFNTLAGFTRADVERAVDELFAGNPALAADARLGDRARMLETLEQHYDGYRFARKVTERVFNSDMVLYFLRELENKGEYPSSMLDLNVRTDYGRLQRIGTLARTGGARRRALLESILADGYVLSELVEQFGARSLASDEQLISLLYYMGMLTIGPQPPDAAVPRLEIPNRVIRELLFRAWSGEEGRARSKTEISTQRRRDAGTQKGEEGMIEESVPCLPSLHESSME